MCVDRSAPEKSVSQAYVCLITDKLRVARQEVHTCYLSDDITDFNTIHYKLILLLINLFLF